MNCISRYMLRQLAVGVIFASLALAGVIWLTQSLRFVDSIINRGLSAGDFFYLTILLMPNFLTIVLPIALFLVVVFVYSKMNADRELVILRAAGVSPLSVAKPALFMGLLVTVISYGLTLYLTPISYKKFRIMQWDIRYSLAHVVLREGEFSMFSDKITVYVRERTGENELLGILVHDSHNKKKPVTYLAKRGILAETPNGARVVMFEGSRQELDRSNPKKDSTLFFDQYNLDLSGVAKKPKKRYREPRERMIGELLTLKKEDIGNPNDYGKFVIEAHQRFISPLNGLGFILVGLVCLLAGDFSRRGHSSRITLAVIIIVGLQAGSMGLANLAAKNVELVPLLYANSAIPIVVGLGLLIFQPRWRNPFGARRAPSPAEAG